MANFFRHRGYFGPAPDGSLLWSPSLGATNFNRPKNLQNSIIEVAQLVDSALEIPNHLLTVAQFLSEQGYLSPQPDLSPAHHREDWNGKPLYRWNAFHPKAMLEFQDAGWHFFTNDGQGNAWLYFVGANQGPCLECLMRRWLASHRLGCGFSVLWQAGAIRWGSTSDPCISLPISAPDSGSVAYFQPDRGWLNFPVARLPNCKNHESARCCGHTHPLQARPGEDPFAIVSSLDVWPPNDKKLTIAVARTGWLEALGATSSMARVVGGGCHSDPDQSLKSAACEAIERYCPQFLGRTIRRPWKKADSVWVPARYSKKSPLNKFNPRLGQELDWVEAQVLGFSGETAAVASSQVYLCDTPDFQTAPGHSHGLSCGSDLEQAILGGLWELIERDAVARFWTTFLDEPHLSATLAHQEGSEALFLFPPSLVGRVAICMLVWQGKPVFGSAAHDQDPSPKAYREAVHNLEFLKNYAPDPSDQEPTSFREHLAYYWHRPQLFPWDNLKQLPTKATGSAVESAAEPAKSAQEIAAILASHDISTAYVDLTTRDVKDLGLAVVRVLAPQMLSHPDHHHGWPNGLKRWKQLFGHQNSPRLPHPFG